MFTEFWARVYAGWDNRGAPQMAAWLRGTTDSPSDFLAAFDAMFTISPEPFLAAIKAPTLILHALDSEGASRDARSLAGGIAGAHLMGIPGWPIGTAINETVVNAILEFINAGPAAPGRAIAAPQVDISAVRTIVFTDVEGSTALTERLGDEGARKVLREHERLTREALGQHGGSEVKAMGDGFMAWFPSATRAVECAIALQTAFEDRNRTVGAQHTRSSEGDRSTTGGSEIEYGSQSARAAPLRPATHPTPLSARPEALVGRAGEPSEPIRVRIGINAGEPIAEGDDLFGASVIATARIASQASGGQILASDVVRQLLAGKGFTFEDRGEAALKGFDEPVRLYEVRWQEEA
jgi:class 3 adenylate cyclase